MSTELTKLDAIKSIVTSEAMQKQFALAMPKHMSADRFTRIVITTLTKTPKLAECTQSSLFQCLLDLTRLGLEPDNRTCHLIPYGKTCQLILDYKGLVELVKRNGDVASIHADIICKNDTFVHEMKQVKTHTFELGEDRGHIIGGWACAEYKDGTKQYEIMTKAEIDKIRNASKAGQSGPWKDHYEQMAKKTVVRRLCNMLTLSPEIKEMVQKADDAEFRNVTPTPAEKKPTADAKPEPKTDPPVIDLNDLPEQDF